MVRRRSLVSALTLLASACTATTGEPSIIDNLQKDAGFDPPPFYAAHNIVSIIDVIIKGNDDQPYGILEIDNDRQHDYDQHDINFLTGFANVLAEAVST